MHYVIKGKNCTKTKIIKSSFIRLNSKATTVSSLSKPLWITN